jgi:hypothetical protein
MAFDPDAYLAEGGGVTETPFDPDSYLGIEKPEPREFFSFEDAVSAIGTIPEALAVGVPAAYQKLVTGLEIPEKSEAIESELAFQQRIQTEQEDRVASGKATSVGSAIRQAVPSLGFSVLPMVAAIPAGIGGAMAGGPAAPVTGPAAAMAASGTVAYRMAGSDMMYRAYKQLEEAKGSPLTNEEKAEYYKTVLPIAQNYGLWEAGPEAVSNAITMGVGKFVFGFGKQAAKKLVGESIDSANKTIARKVAEKGAAVAGGLGAEIASEGVTAVGQYPEEAKIRQLAATGEVSEGEQPSYPGGYIQAVKDVAPATIALYGMMGTAAGGVKLSTLPFRSQKTPEQIAEDNINLEADRVSRELSIGETDEETKSINAALETARNNLIAKKEVYTALEPNDPAAQSLGLEIREMEREVVALDNELKKRIGEPLSEPIIEAERQQAELAKAIVEEPAPTVKESLTVQPTEAAPVAAPVEQVVTPPVEVAPTIAEAAPVEPITPAPEVAMTMEQDVDRERKGIQDKIKTTLESNKPFVFRGDGFKMMITKSSKEGAKYQATLADEKGPYADFQFDSLDKIDEDQIEIISYIIQKDRPDIPDDAPFVEYGNRTFQYELRGRPAGPKTVPSGYISTEKGGRYGIASFDRILTDKEIKDYELKPIGYRNETAKATTPAPTPAPVTEQAAPAEAPAPEVAPAIEKPKTILYRDTNLDNAVYLLDPDATSPMQELFVAESPEMAIGQKGNTGILIEFDASKINAKPNMKKPGTAVAIQTGSPKEMVATGMDNRDFQQAVTSFSYDPKSIPKNRLQRLSVLEQKLKSAGWSKTELADGKIKVSRQPTPAVSETITEPTTAPTGIAVGNRIKLGKSPQTYTIEEVIPQSEAEKELGEQYYSVKNEKTGETQVVEKNDMKLVAQRPTVKKTKSNAVTHSFTPRAALKPEDQMSEQAILDSAKEKLGGTLPKNVVVVNDTETTNGYGYVAAYNPQTNQLELNQAFLRPDDDLESNIAHELGHYIYQDPRLKKAFSRLYKRLKASSRRKLDAFMEQAYSDYVAEDLNEEKLIRAYENFLNDAPDNRNIFQRFLDEILDFFTEALSNFSPYFSLLASNPRRLAKNIAIVAAERFKSGEVIEGVDTTIGQEKRLARAAEPRRTRIMGVEAGEEVKTPEGIIAKTQELLRKQFDPTKVTEQNTTEAFRAIGRLTSKQGNAFAEELNDLGRVEGSEVSMGAALFVNDLFEYSIRLAAEGNKKMLGIMMANINKLPTAMIGASDAGRTLAARAELKARFSMMGRAEQDAYTNYVAEFIYGPNPTKEQIQSIKDAYAAVDKTEPITEQELTDEITAVGDRTGTDLVGKINDEFTKATEKGKEKRRTEEQELDREYKKVQRQADAEIEKLAKIQSDTPSFDPAAARQITNDVRAIVSNDLKQKPDMGRKAPWKSMLVAKLQEAGVELTAAETLADIVWRQHEINSLSRELSSINKAIEKGPISEIVKAIKDTPLEDQQNPNWRYEVMRDYLRRAGLNVAQSERIAKLMDISLQKRFTMAQEQAFTDAISKSAPWKTGDTRSRRAFQKVLQALRAGALDPARNVLSDMAALNGWTGFTPDQYKVLLKNDAILSDPESADATKAEAHKAIQDIISKAKLPIRARDVIGQFYDAQALSGIPTMTVNIFSPAGMAVKNTLTQSLNGVLTARPEQITASLTTFIDSIKSWANTVAFSFKNNVTVYSNVEYLVNDEGLLKLYKRGVDQFNKGKTPRERADGVKNMMIGMMDYVRRVLNALDYGAIASLQNQAVSKYALAVMQAKGMSSKDGAKMLNAMMEQKRNFYNDQIAIGTDKNKAAVLADEFFVSSWRQALTDAKLPVQEVMDAALNDAMSAVGRNRQSLDAFREEDTNTRDEGVVSYPAIWLLETMANAANKADNQVVKLFSRMIYGFAVVPARVFRETAWFSPYGGVRFAYDYIAKKMGKTSPYAQSLGNDLQYRQRLTETITGSLVMLAFAAAMSASTDDEDDEKPFKIVVTGNGPLRRDDPQFYDSWTKNNRPNTVRVQFGKTKFTINTMRGFEAFAWPAMMLGAVDDWHIRRKQNRETKTPAQIGDAAIVGGFVLSASLRRGPYAFAAKPLFEAYGDRGVESLAKSLAFPAKTLVPVLGASLASNISNFLNEPVDRRTLDGALWANVPFIGPAVASKSLNAFGEPAMANDPADKIFKLGLPIVFDIPTDRDSVNLHELVLKQGGGPSIPTRNQLAQRLDRQPTNKEYEMFVKEYGAKISSDMKRRYEELSNKTPEQYSKSVEKIGNRARDIAERKVREAAKKP